MNKAREYGIDALRIVSMMMVVALHVLAQGGILENLEWKSVEYSIAWLIEVAAYGAVNCFGLISGYVGVKSKHKYSGIISLWLQVVFYSTILSVVAHAFWPTVVHGKEWMNGFFPVNKNYYWYYSAYFFLSFLIPLINKILLSVPRKEIAAGLIPVVVLLSLNTTVFQYVDSFGVKGGYSAIWVLILYMMGGYIRLYGEHAHAYVWIKNHALSVFFLGTLAAWSIKVWLGEKTIYLALGFGIGSEMLIGYVSPTILLSSVALFSMFANWKPGKGVVKLISCISPAAFSVYLIHTHPSIWQCCMKDGFVFLTQYKGIWFLIAVIGAVVGVYSVCTVIDLCRIMIFKALDVRGKCQQLMNKIGLS